jgi:exportin-2 (importin alpha re-exporter)
VAGLDRCVALIYCLSPIGSLNFFSQQLVASLSPADYSINIGVLQTAHSIFNQWRSLVRSDELFSEIILVLGKFMTPFLQLFQQTANTLLENPNPSGSGLVSPTNYPLLGEAMVLLLDIFYDFNCQDLPPAIEDNSAMFFHAQTGYLPRLISWDSPSLKGDVRLRLCRSSQCLIINSPTKQHLL